MATPHEMEPLSRAVSQIDLNTALRTLKDSDNTPWIPSNREKSKVDLTKYSRDEIIQIRTGTENNPIDRAEHSYNSKPDPHAVVTPPYLSYPKVPPPTPATRATVPEEPVAELPIIVEDAEDKLQEVEKKKKKKSKKKAPAATGFEEFYADAPTTPAEHEEEKWIYGEAYPFEERIQNCIQKYRARRKLNSERSNILTQYLILGGVESSAKAFGGGLDRQTIENSTAEEIAAIQATDYVRTHGWVNAKTYDGSENWVVDWEGIAKGYFSHRMPDMFPMEVTEHRAFLDHIAVIRNFLSYVLLHGVCPEYTKEVMAAKQICDKAEKQLWAIKLLAPKLPGPFNIAASTKYNPDGKWTPLSLEPADTWDTHESETKNLTAADADRIFKVGIVLAGNDDDKLFEDISKPDMRIKHSEQKYVEVISIQRATPKVFEDYSTITDNYGETGTLKPLGTFTVKPWKGPENRIPEAELTVEEQHKMKNLPENYETFFLEDEILELYFVGLRMEIVVHELEYGVKFLNDIRGLWCSFYTYLEQEKMDSWKEPLPNKRPPPMEDDDPDAEEKRAESEAEEAAKE